MLRDFCNQFDFPRDATEAFCSAFEKIAEKGKLYSVIDEFYQSDSKEYRAKLEALAEEWEIPLYTLWMIFLILAAEPLREEYGRRGIDETIYRDTLMDLKPKLLECYRVEGIWGTSVLWWFERIYRCKLFALGRLQYEEIEATGDYDGAARKGDVVLNCHIPAGLPLTPEGVEESLKLAYEFYGYQDDMVVVCLSWMLYPPYYELFPEGSNLRSFYDRFCVVRSIPDENNLWRIFGTNDMAKVNPAEVKTTLQKNFYEYLKQGNSTGVGDGYLIYRKDKEELQ